MPEASKAIAWDDNGEAFDDALRQAAEGVIDAQGVRLSSAQLRRLLDATPEDSQHPGRHLLREAIFEKAIFEGNANFGGVTFEGDAYFHEAIFERNADFHGATFAGYAGFGEAIFGRYTHFSGTTFGGSANFHGATFPGYAGFGEAIFGRGAVFIGATFRGDAQFSRATFGDRARFGGVTFGDRARFGGATFGDHAFFGGATFGGLAHFTEATFGGLADFREATFGGLADFIEATFEQATDLGPVVVFGQLVLHGAVFAQPVTIVVSARRTTLRQAVFRAGADLFVRWAEVSLEDADFAEPSLLAELPAHPGPEGERGFLGWEEPVADGGWVCRMHAA